MPEVEDTSQNCDDFPGSRNQRKDMLLKVSHHIIDTYLTYDLKNTNDQYIFDGRGIVLYKLEERYDTFIHEYGKDKDNDEGIEVSGRKQLIGRRFVLSFVEGLRI